MLELAKLIDLIVGFASPMVQSKLQRSELVIKLLKQLHLDPDHPPADFTAVYQYTLVEYGIGKPKPVLELFRQAEIQAIFRKALDQNHPSLLLQEGETFLAGHSLGDQIQALGIEARQEFYQFAAVFIEVAKRTRTPAEVLSNQRLESLHRQIGSIQERLHRLPTLEAMRTEMARLAAQGYPMLPGTIATPALAQERQFQERQCRAFALAQQMKGWFETLGYRFESYEVWQDEYFEWIIDIPVRRGRYDRILVRGVDGEVGLSDIKALRQSVETQRADEGWLITARRISRAAREAVEQEENHDLGCYTFDELLDQDADFGGYLDWLEAEIQRRGIDHKYVPLACTKEEIDPDTKQRMGVSRYDDRDGWIDGYIDLWLDDPAKEHISVLGEFGTGKTWFAFHYASQALKRYREAQQRGVERPRLPLVIPLRDYAKAVSVESLFSEFFFRKHEVRSLTYSAFEQLNRMGKLLLIFDGFDEMAARVDRQEMINNFWELAKVVVPGAKVILTCRTEHFPEAREGRALLNAQLQASTASLTGEMPQFEVLELEKFNDAQIREVMLLQAESATVEQVMSNPQLLDLARRPVMTELILEALPDIEAGKPVDMSRVYLYAVRRKMERDIKEERTFTSLAEKLYFLCELSWEMLSSDRMSLNYREFPDRIRRLFGSVVQEEKDLDHWHYDMMGQTMLIRNADGDYMPAHRSLLEFFVAYKFAAELGALAPDFTELSRVQSHLNASAQIQDYTWSSYFQKQVNNSGQITPIAPLHSFISESLASLRKSFGQAPLSKAVTDLLLLMLDFTSKQDSSLQNILNIIQGKTEFEVGYIGGNIATLLVKLDRNALEGKDLSHTVIHGADFTNASLRLAKFARSDLSGSSFIKVFGAVLSISYSPDAQLFATGEANGWFRIWRMDIKQSILACKGHTDWLSSIAFSPSGNTLATCSHDHTIKVWNFNNGECLKIFQGHTGAVRSLAFAPDSKTLISGGDDRTVRIWNIDTEECVRTLQGHAKRVWSVAISSDGKVLASGSEDQTIKVWDFLSGECIKTLQGHVGSVAGVAISPDIETLASGSNDKTVKIWDLITGECLRTLNTHSSGVRSISINPNGKTLASGSNDQTVRLWDLQTGKCLHTFQDHSGKVRTVTVSPDGTSLLSGSNDQTVKLWDLQAGKCLHTFQGHTGWINSLSILSEDGIVASGGEEGTVKFWNIHTGECLKILSGHTSWINSLTANSKDEFLVSCSGDRTVRVWNINDGVCLNTLSMGDSRGSAVAISPSGETVACAGSNKTIKLWSVYTGECLNTLKDSVGWVLAVLIGIDNRTLFSAGEDSTIKTWDIQTGECLSTWQGHSRSVWSLAFNPDYKILASGSDDCTIKLWETSSGQCFRTLQSHGSRVNSLTFSDDGKFLASGSSDETIRVWDIETKECLMVLDGHTNRVQSVAFTSDSKTLVSGSYDETIKIWDVTTGECLRTIINKPYAEMDITEVKGLTEAEKATLKSLGAIEH